jgi:hypothetical protein
LQSFWGGTFQKGHLKKNVYKIKITQNKNVYFERIKHLMSMFGKVQIKKNGNGYDLCVFNKRLYKWIKRNCYKDGYGFRHKTVPKFIRNNSRDVIDSFLETFCNGDGYIKNNQRHYTTSSKYLVDDTIELICKIGKKSGCYVKSKAGSKSEIDGRTITRTCDNWVIYECKENKNGYNYGIQSQERTNSKKDVYSIIIDSDTRMMFTMCKNNKPIWTHNGGVSDDMVKRGYNTHPINFAQAANDKALYDSVISEMWFNIADKIDEIELLEDDDELKEELTTRLWKMDRKGRRCVESKAEFKKRIGRSPDSADALMICFYEHTKGLQNLGNII